MKRIYGISLLVLIVISLSIPANAGIRKAEQPLTDNVLISQVFDNPVWTHFGIPERPKTSKDLLILCFAGAAYQKILVVANDSVPYEKITSPLEKITASGAFSSKDIIWSQEYGYTLAEINESHAKMLSSSAQNFFDPNKLVAAFREAGFTPNVVLRIPKYCKVDTLQERHNISRRYWWYNLSTGSDRPIHITETLPALVSQLLNLYVFFIPLVLIIGILLGIRIMRTENIPLEKKKKLFSYSTVYAGYAALGIFMVATISLFVSPLGFTVADIWFGVMNPEKVVFGLLLTVLIPASLIISFLLVYVKIFAGFASSSSVSPRIEECSKEETKIPHQKTHKSVIETIESTLSFIFSALILLCFLVKSHDGIMLISFIKHNPWIGISLLVVIFSFFFAGLAMFMFMAKKRKQMRQSMETKDPLNKW